MRRSAEPLPLHEDAEQWHRRRGGTLKLLDLTQLISPENTILLLGAGASIPSGAPTGAGLAKALANKLRPSPDSDELADVCGIYEHRLGRSQLAKEIKQRLGALAPTGGILALPAHRWKALYTTNFDRLVEDSYRLAGVELNVVRSNYEFSEPHTAETVLYKIHGCISQDAGFGHQARMVLTELDYDDVSAYRQALFTSMANHMFTANTLIVGQSLRDPHLRNLAKEIARLRQQGVPGRILLLVYDYSEDRATLLEQRGIEVVQGTLEDLLQALGQARPSVSDDHSIRETAGPLPSRLAPTTIDVAHAVGLTVDPVRLFNGSPASYADIAGGLTIARAVEARIELAQNGARGFFLVLSGAAGVGKTSLGRRLLHRRFLEQFGAWEHNNSFALDHEAWLQVEAKLRSEGRQGVLLVDDCAQHLGALNKLVNGLGALDRPFLRVVATVNSGQWRTRMKSKYFNTRGTTEKLSLLTETDIRGLVKRGFPLSYS